MFFLCLCMVMDVPVLSFLWVEIMVRCLVTALRNVLTSQAQQYKHGYLFLNLKSQAQNLIFMN